MNDTIERIAEKYTLPDVNYPNRPMFLAALREAMREVREQCAKVAEDDFCNCIYDPDQECPGTCTGCRIAAAIREKNL